MSILKWAVIVCRFELHSCVGHANSDRKLSQHRASGALQRWVLAAAVRGQYSHQVPRLDCRLLPHDRSQKLSSPSRGDVGDIGLIRVRWELSLGPTIAQTHFMPEGFLLPHNVPLLIVGWGSTTGGTVINDNLYSLLLQTKKFDACEKAYKTFPGTRPGNVSTHMICTGLSTSAGRDFDAIDTGAPLFFGNTVVGVASFGVSRGNNEMPIVATEISYYTGWIITTAV
ncbi:unnamed protein product [Arctia plantaginis]|uniref:Peptidase S1 domain-containing protein n=1 Tax=Arctia plantaginis TaxID=874455 RepID=A0A8S0YQJ1_ARCPL|nr:unnamed protein product [Arctia plantaginis]